jgi:hypothetical protein
MHAWRVGARLTAKREVWVALAILVREIHVIHLPQIKSVQYNKITQRSNYWLVTAPLLLQRAHTAAWLDRVVLDSFAFCRCSFELKLFSPAVESRLAGLRARGLSE